jgi:hypothetical protein
MISLALVDAQNGRRARPYRLFRALPMPSPWFTERIATRQVRCIAAISRVLAFACRLSLAYEANWVLTALNLVLSVVPMA